MASFMRRMRVVSTLPIGTICAMSGKFVVTTVAPDCGEPLMQPVQIVQRTVEQQIRAE